MNSKCNTNIIKRGYGYYCIDFYFNHKHVGSGWATNRRNAEKIAKMFTHPDNQYSQIGREIKKL